jgi:hypothetical protein
LYQRTAGNMRRLLESVGLQRRAKDVTPTLADLLRGPPLPFGPDLPEEPEEQPAADEPSEAPPPARKRASGLRSEAES